MSIPLTVLEPNLVDTMGEASIDTPVLTKIQKYCTYLCFSTKHDLEAARQSFVKRYGVEPAEVVRDHNLIWVGPCPGKVKP
jgi:hypothetical protein